MQLNRRAQHVVMPSSGVLKPITSLCEPIFETLINMESSDCIFCQLRRLTNLSENQLAVAVLDKYPVRPLYKLIVPKRHVDNIFETRAEEREAIHGLTTKCREKHSDKPIKKYIRKNH